MSMSPERIIKRAIPAKVTKDYPCEIMQAPKIPARDAKIIARLKVRANLIGGDGIPLPATGAEALMAVSQDTGVAPIQSRIQ